MQCTTYFQCWLNGNFRSRLWLNCSVAKFYAMWRHTNNEQWQKNWVSCLLKLLSNYNFKLENHAIFYDFQSTLTFLVILGPRGGGQKPPKPSRSTHISKCNLFLSFQTILIWIILEKNYPGNNKTHFLELAKKSNLFLQKVLYHYSCFLKGYIDVWVLKKSVLVWLVWWDNYLELKLN